MTAVTERTLPASCWCERTTVMVPVQWISEAKTGSCGPLCGPGCPSRADQYESDDYCDDPTEVARTGKKGKMKRFTPERYDPRIDSTFGYAQGGVRIEHPNAVILETVGGDPRLCACGCAEAPRGKTATFGMGHDARLRGKLARALAGGSEIVLADHNHVVHEVLTPQEYAGRFSTDKLDWAKSIEESAAKAKRTSGDEAERAILAKALGPQVGETKVIKIGRWEKTGRIVAVYDEGGRIVYEYADKSGKAHRVESDANGKLHEVAVA